MASHDDLVKAIDKRAEDRVKDYQAQNTLAVGHITGVTLSGASVQLEGSGRYLKNVSSLQGSQLVTGATVLLARVGRGDWVILGAVELKGSITPTTDNYVPLAAPAGLSVTDMTDGTALIEWTASYFDIRAWELSIGAASEAGSASDFVTDNSQYLWEAPTVGTYYCRCRAAGPNWERSAWTAWQQFSVTNTIVLDHGDLTGLGDDDHTIYVLADGTRDLAFTPTVLADWDSDADPGDVDDALDQLAERMTDLEEAPQADASNITYTPDEVLDWSAGDPGDVDDALDELAYRVTRSEDQVLRYLFSQLVDIEVGDTSESLTLLDAGRGTKTIDGTVIDGGTIIKLQAGGHMSCQGSPNIQFHVMFDDVEMYATGLFSPGATLSEVQWSIDTTIVCRTTGASGTFVSAGRLLYSDNARSGESNPTPIVIDTTGDIVVDLLARWSVQSSNNTITCQWATISLATAHTLAVGAPSELAAEEV